MYGLEIFGWICLAVLVIFIVSARIIVASEQDKVKKKIKTAQKTSNEIEQKKRLLYALENLQKNSNNDYSDEIQKLKKSIELIELMNQYQKLDVVSTARKSEFIKTDENDTNSKNR